MLIKIWLDDVRPVPDDSWFHFKSGEECLEFIEWAGLANITAISFDNDLGEGQMEGYQILDWIEESVFTRQVKLIPVMTVHSANPVAHKKMEMIIERIYKSIENHS